MSSKLTRSRAELDLVLSPSRGPPGAAVSSAKMAMVEMSSTIPMVTIRRNK
jgi:hypothetical protein